MKHLRQRTKTQRANAAILSILTVLSPLQVFGSVLAPIDLGEYFFEVYVDFSHYFRWLFANFRECSLIS